MSDFVNYTETFRVPAHYRPWPHFPISARLVEELRRKRERRLALVRAEREWIVGGKLIDHQAPIMSQLPGESDVRHAQRVKDELGLRRKRMQVESTLLAYHFARRCLIPLAERDRMREEWCAWDAAYGAPGSAPTHSTARSTATLTGRTIPRL